MPIAPIMMSKMCIHILPKAPWGQTASGWEPPILFFGFKMPATYEGEPPKTELIYKNCVLILTCSNFSHLQSALHLMPCTYQDGFSPAQKQCLNLLILMPFSASATFLFHLFHISKMFPFEDFFPLGKQRSRSAWDQVNREGGAWGVILVLVKNRLTPGTV